MRRLKKRNDRQEALGERLRSQMEKGAETGLSYERIAVMELFEKICRQLALGELLGPPEALSGGFMHKMYSLETERGKYALKLLNPHIMKRNSAMANYRQAEQLERMLEDGGIPILPALLFHGKKMQETEGQYYYLFRFFSGRALQGSEIEVCHCERMGRALAQIHGIQRRREKVRIDEIHGDWTNYLEKLSEQGHALEALIRENLERILDWEKEGNAALSGLPEEVTICHNDMDSKNVLWRGGEFRIIDLECLSWESPYLELYDLALNWAGYEECAIDQEKLKALVNAYGQGGGRLPEDWECLYEAEKVAKLDWLEFNLKRALGLEGDESDKPLGVSMVKWAIRHLQYYAEARDRILEALAGRFIHVSS